MSDRLTPDEGIEHEVNVHRPLIEAETNRELGTQEQRMINRRAEWNARMREKRGWA